MGIRAPLASFPTPPASLRLVGARLAHAFDPAHWLIVER